MAEEDEVSKIMAVAEKYSNYFNEWHSDIAMGRKGPNFFYVYNDQYRYFEVFEEFRTAEELEKLIIGTMAENMETFNAVALENTQKMFENLDINENVGSYDPDFHIYKLLRQMEIMTGQLEHWSELVAGTYRSFANVCKDMKFGGKKRAGTHMSNSV